MKASHQKTLDNHFHIQYTLERACIRKWLRRGQATFYGSISTGKLRPFLPVHTQVNATASHTLHPLSGLNLDHTVTAPSRVKDTHDTRRSGLNGVVISPPLWEILACISHASDHGTLTLLRP